MPNYNKRRYISEAVRSVLSQTLEDFELLVVDDGSTDGSARTAEELASCDHRVEVLRLKRHSGASAARNAGLERAKGKLVSFLDSDDLLARTKLERQVSELGEGDRDQVVYCDWSRVDGNGTALKPFKRDHLKKSGMIFPDLLIYGLPVNASIMARRECFRSVGAYDESIAWGEDHDMLLRLAARYPFRYVDEKLYAYRVYEGNTFSTVPRATRFHFKAVLLERHMNLQWEGLDRVTRRRARRRLLSYYSAAGENGKLLGSGMKSVDGIKFLGRMVINAGKGYGGQAPKVH